MIVKTHDTKSELQSHGEGYTVSSIGLSKPGRTDVSPVSVCIVNYNAGTLLAECVEAVLASTVSVEVFVSDNGSTDRSLGVLRERFGSDPRVCIIENRKNLGFAKATNIGLRRAAGDYCLVLNPDCLVQPDTLARVINNILRDPKVGVAGCMIRNPDGTEQAGGRRSVPTPWRSLVRILNLNKWLPTHPRVQTYLHNREPIPNEPIAVEAISGAFMLAPRRSLQQVGLLDERYFLHCEDLDWCMRFRQAGWKILFVPDTEVVHHKGTCSQSRPIFVEWHKHRGMLRFYRTHFRHQYPWYLMFAVFVGVWMRFGWVAARGAMARKSIQQAPADASLSSPAEPKTVTVNSGSEGRRPVVEPERESFEWRGRPVLVTGGTGFIGRHLVAELMARGARVKILARPRVKSAGISRRQCDRIDGVCGDLSNPASLVGVCDGVDTVFHLAGYAHADDDSRRLEDSPHWRITVDGTEALLDDSIAAGVKHIVFASTVKAMGEGTKACLDETAFAQPEDHYGKAKLEAERRVLAAGRRGNMQTAVLRLTMVYGRDNAGNVPRMMSAIDRGRFPPLPETHNRRSMVHVSDVVQALLLAVERPIANGQVYIVTDDEVYSSCRIYESMCQALGRRLPAWRVPASLLRAAGRMGDVLRALHLWAPVTSTAVRKLLGSAYYSCEKAKRELGYRPRHKLEDALPEIVSCARAQQVNVRPAWVKE